MLLCNIAAFGVALVSVLRNVIYPDIPFLTTITYYGVYFIFLMIFLVVELRKLHIHPIWIPFYVVSLLSIISGNPSPIFHPWERFASFCIVSLTVGPLIDSPRLILFRQRLLWWVLLLISAGCIVSLGLWIFRSPMAINSRTGLVNGIFSNSMLLCPLAGLLLLNSIRPIFLTNSGRFRRVLYLALAFGISVLMFVSASRIAFAALVGALMAFLYMTYKNKPKTLLIFITLFISASAISFSKWNPYLENIERKMERDEIEQSGDIFQSRRNLWLMRIQDFKLNPILGSGFASMDLSIRQQKVSRKTGTVEPGSGWLFLLSSTGILGTLCFICPLLITLLRLFRRAGEPNNADISYSVAILTFFCIHTIAEGYLLASGSLLFMLFWLHIFIGQNQQLTSSNYV